MADLVIRGGTVVDGTAAPARTADVAITDGVITEVGRVDGRAGREIDADGLLVTPGFVDVHTHYDGQITWDPLLTPSCWHGVTTIVMGNCGVGFAPVAPERHDWLIGLMEGVEDIPGAALSAGIQWGWESFPEYLDAIDRVPKAIDVGAQVPHGAVRGYVMGERGAKNEPATADDIAAMAAIVREGIEAGALGFSTSRTLAHRAIDGEPVPGTFAAEDELFGIGRVLGELGAGVFELAPAGALGEDLAAPEKEVAWMRRLAAATGRPVTFALNQNNNDPDAWRKLLELSADAARDGAPITPQVHGRTVSLLLGLQTFHPFNFCPTWAEVGLYPWAEQAARLPALRDRLVDEARALENDPIISGFMHPARIFVLGDPPNYEPSRADSVAGIAKAQGRPMWEVLFDLLLVDGGRELLNSPVLNYTEGNLDAAREMLMHPTSAFGLGDGGAHAGQTCDASTTTYMLSYWARDRTHDRIPIETAVQKISGATAALFGLGDRGALAPGKKADVNIIDFDRLQLRRPESVSDLPGGASRLIQRSDGYVATINSGLVTFDRGEDTGARPGVLLRGAR
ncbi:MAG TPA: amidohydrolase family protein [Acidimicrobiales bacterium]|jgi:N-acyl-D-aspartate/D-glutamate deacylase|nr:amidohydrolase family protein [Acidimicrobiales bacterium]